MKRDEIQSLQEVLGTERQLTPEQKEFAETGTWIPDARSRHILSALEWDSVLGTTVKKGDTNGHNG